MISDKSKVKQFGQNMDVEGPEDFFLKLSLNDTLIPGTWQRIRSFYFAGKDIPDPQDLIKVRDIYAACVQCRFQFKYVNSHPSNGSTAQVGPWPPPLRILNHTYIRHTVGLLWTSDQPVAETSTYTGYHNM
jgi:hypothetical protein